MHKSDESILITYDCNNKQFQYFPNDLFPSDDSRQLWDIMTEEEMTSAHIAASFRNKLEEIAGCDTPQVYNAQYYIRQKKQKGRWYRVNFVYPVPYCVIHIIFTDIDHEVNAKLSLAQKTEYDELTGLLNHNAFCKNVTLHLNNNKVGKKAGEYAVVYFDVLHFKAINDMFGMSEGTRLLKYIAQAIRENVPEDDIVCRQGSDRFILFTHTFGNALETLIQTILNQITKFDLEYEITCNVGIYVTNEEELAVDSMIDRAILAQASIKGNYEQKYSYFTESMRKDMINEQEIGGMMATALSEKQFIIHYQPQYNHSNGMIVGAEALVRWQHPEQGLISPGIFIPIFEKNGFITKLDLFVFEQVCIFIRKCLDKNINVVPISTNFSRHDIFYPNFVEILEEIREKYQIPSAYLRVEVTESAVVGNNQNYVNEVLKKLHHHGYIIEMDDFGSGYSSLNVLKDIEMDILKLDMLFLSENNEIGSDRGGTILSSVVRMAKWLGMPVIAEGVEDIRQADFLRSIGCEYIQGYLYSKPLPEHEYETLLENGTIGPKIQQFQLMETFNAGDFWNPKSQETLIFSYYVGGAAIFCYHNNIVELLRVNTKYASELSSNLSEKDIILTDLLSTLSDEDKKIYLDMLAKAIETFEEQQCDTWRNLSSFSDSTEKVCIRSNVRMIGKGIDSYLFYASIRNVTTEKMCSLELSD